MGKSKNHNFIPIRNLGILEIVFCFAFLLVSWNRGTEPNPIREEFFALDTVIQMTLYGNEADQALTVAKERLEEYEARFSVTNPDSEVSKLNQSKGESVQASSELREQLSVAKLLSEKSGGAFDVTIYPVMKAWGFYGTSMKEKEYRVPMLEELEENLKLVNYDNVRMEGNNIQLMNGSLIDLGGIAKGYIGRLIKDELKEMGITGAIISLGGNVQTIGRKPNGGQWTVGVTDPNHPDELLGTILCGEMAVVTSGSYQRNFTKEGMFYHHIMDPKTGYPVDNGLLSVTVICEDGMEADGLSTALFVLGEEKAMDYYSRFKGFEAVFVTNRKEIILTGGLRDDFQLQDEKKEYKVIISS